MCPTCMRMCGVMSTKYSSSFFRFAIHVPRRYTKFLESPSQCSICFCLRQTIQGAVSASTQAKLMNQPVSRSAKAVQVTHVVQLRSN